MATATATPHGACGLMGMLWPVTKAHQATRALCFRVTDNLSSFLSVLWTDWVLVAGSLGVP